MDKEQIKKYEVLKLAFRAINDGDIKTKKLESIKDFPKEHREIMKDNIQSEIFLIGHFKYYFNSIISEILEGEHLEL